MERIKTISLCMIVKNEGDIIGTTLDRVYDYVQEIIVVDTGSTDDTVRIVNRYTDKIFSFEWCNDFSKARNYANSFASCDYIMNIDADELVVNLDFFEKVHRYDNTCFSANIESCVCERSQSNDYDFYIKNRVIGKENTRVVLFKNHEGFYYNGIIHEYLCDKFGRRVGKTGQPFLNLLNVNSPGRLREKDIYYNALAEIQLERENNSKRSSNSANLYMNLLHYYSNKNDYEKFDKIFERYSECVFDNYISKNFVELVNKLIIRKQYIRAKSILQWYRKRFVQDICLLNNEISEDTIWNTCYIYNVIEKYRNLQEWEEKLKGFRIQAKSYYLCGLILRNANFNRVNFLIESIPIAFKYGFDFFELSCTYESIVYNDSIIKILSEYPVTFILDIYSKDIGNKTYKKNLVKITHTIGKFFIRIHSMNLDVDLIESYIEQSLAFTRNFIVNLGDALEQLGQSSVYIDNNYLFHQIELIFNKLIEFSIAKKFYLLFEGVPLCLAYKCIGRFKGYIKEINTINDYSLYAGINTPEVSECHGCLISKWCLPTCHNAVGILSGKNVLTKIGLIDLIRVKSIS
ncbi:glycosyltransferase [Ruminiclostridium herbifermentans]|nr:glycosyltransferase [Ruminiclostridium herbifermentans]